jgi:hypothetical protein
MDSRLEYGGHSYMDSIGVRKATTFTGFCEFHDTTIFRPIEVYDYTPGNKEQEFLFAYRALAKEYYTKTENYISTKRLYEIITNNDFESMRKYINEGYIVSPSHLAELQEFYFLNLKGYSSALEMYERYRAGMNINIQNHDFHAIKTQVIVFPTMSRLAVSSLINIAYDLEGNLINDVNHPKAYISPIF